MQKTPVLSQTNQRNTADGQVADIILGGHVTDHTLGIHKSNYKPKFK